MSPRWNALKISSSNSYASWEQALGITEIGADGSLEGIWIDDHVGGSEQAGGILDAGEQDGLAGGEIVPTDSMDMTGKESAIGKAELDGGEVIGVGGERDPMASLPGARGAGHQFKGLLSFLPFTLFVAVMKSGGELDDGVGGQGCGSVGEHPGFGYFEHPFMSRTSHDPGNGIQPVTVGGFFLGRKTQG
jgi:hypothetical protein